MAKVVEACVADKDRAIEDLKQRQRAAEQKDQVAHFARGIKEICNQPPRGKKDDSGQPARRYPRTLARRQ